MNYGLLTGLRTSRGLGLAAALLVLTIFASAANADEPPTEGGSFPPPEDTKPVADTQEPTAAAEDDSNWSRPAAPGARAGTPSPTNATLPPPRVVRRRSAATPARNAAPVHTPYIRDVPARAATSPGISPTPLDSRRLPTRTPLPATPSTTPACRILRIEKTHNVEAPDIEAAQLFLQFDVEYEVRGQQNRDVFVGIWFARVTDGKFVRSVQRHFADSAGNVTLQTRWTRMPDNLPRRYAATLLIPYAVFPVHETGESYEIEARVQVLRNETGRRVTALARDKTTFRVYGLPPEDVRDEPAGPVLDRIGADSPSTGGEIIEPGIPTGRGAGDVAGETGTIITPGRQDGSGSKATPGEGGVIEDLPEKKAPTGK